MRTVVLFSRDLRVHDHPALHEAAEQIRARSQTGAGRARVSVSVQNPAFHSPEKSFLLMPKVRFAAMVGVAGRGDDA